MIQKAPRTVDVPLLQCSDTTVDVPVAKDAEKTPQRQHEDCMTKYKEIQMEKKLRSAWLWTKNQKQNLFDSESRSDLSFTVQKDIEVIHREVKGRTKINCYLKENQSEFSETGRLKDLVKKHSKIDTRREAALCVVQHRLHQQNDGCTQTKAHARVNRRTDRRCACATADFGRDRRSNEAGPA